MGVGLLLILRRGGDGDLVGLGTGAVRVMVIPMAMSMGIWRIVGLVMGVGVGVAWSLLRSWLILREAFFRDLLVCLTMYQESCCYENLNMMIYELSLMQGIEWKGDLLHN